MYVHIWTFHNPILPIKLGTPYQPHTGHRHRIVAVGGGTKSTTWLQIVSDVAGISQEVPQLTIGASYGDAFLAGLAIGLLKRSDINYWVQPGKIIRPQPDSKDLYDLYYADYRQLYGCTINIVHHLNSMG